MDMKVYQPKAMLVTGGAGFIGANFIRHLLSQEKKEILIINLDKLTYAGSLNNLNNLPNSKRHHFIQGDITQVNLVKKLLQSYQIDTIVHFAAESHVDRSIQRPSTFVETNLYGSFVLLEAARQYWLDKNKFDSTQCRFHHISTDEVYGSLNKAEPLFNEQSAYQPRSPYSATKAGSDHLVHAYYHTYGLPVTLSHCSNNYGPYQHQEKFIPTIIRSCMQSKKIPVYGNGSNIRDWLYVEDHCHAVMKIIERGKIGESYNIGGNNEWENLQLVNYICEILNNLYQPKTSYTELIQFIDDRLGHDFRYAVDTKKISKELDWSPQETFESGITKTIVFYSNRKNYDDK